MWHEKDMVPALQEPTDRREDKTTLWKEGMWKSVLGKFTGASQ